MKKEKIIDELNNILKNSEWLGAELEKCGTRLKILQEEVIGEGENYEEIEAESKLLDELLARSMFERRNVAKLQKFLPSTV